MKVPLACPFAVTSAGALMKEEKKGWVVMDNDCDERIDQLVAEFQPIWSDANDVQVAKPPADSDPKPPPMALTGKIDPAARMVVVL